MADSPYAVRLAAKQHKVGIIELADVAGLSRDQTATIAPADEPPTAFNAGLVDFRLDLRREAGEESLLSHPYLLATDDGALIRGHQHRVRRVVPEDTVEIAGVIGGYDSRRDGADSPNTGGKGPALLRFLRRSAGFRHDEGGQYQGSSLHSVALRSG